MTQLDARKPSKIYRGTVDEVFSHRDEIPPGATVELKVFEERPEAEEETGDFGGKSVLEAFPHLFGTEQGLPADLSTNPAYMQDFGVTKNPRKLGS
ncbi:MAG TPA: hypothetical protein VFB38_26790 [Chthonomonadaceae bacterium]|nr:hypothetical protein [Chthonomonadaceae bacterium]